MGEPGFLQWIGKGLLIGFSIAAPVGPIGVLCIRRSLAEGRQIGLATGLGAATADAAYGCVAAFGLTAISGVLVRQAFWLGLIGGGFLCYLGIRTLLSRPAQNSAGQSENGLWGAYLSTLVLTLTNPMTILSFVAVFAGIGFGASAGYRNAGVLVVGVFAGSALWWVLLSNGAAFFRTRMTDGWMQIVNRISGLIILGFGVYALVTVFSK
jgi:threonine/homoserine/homoserine lactone efflux protein